MLRRSPRLEALPPALVALTLVLGVCAQPAHAQQLQMPGETGVVASDAVPMGTELPSQAVVTAGPTAVQYGGAYFNPTLGAHLRARYTTQSYGQQEGTLDLGTMRLMEVDGGVAFLDGQVTMNDDSGVGYNLGVGYRWITLPLLPYGPDSEKIAGVSIWSDGQTVGQENFFPQLGVSMEMLGERVDFRANGYIPLGPSSRTRDFGGTGDLTYSGNNLVTELIGVRDTAITVGEAELAGRILDLDAWVFGGVYGLNGPGIDTTGGKVGLRGYATPDLLLSIAIANDDEFDTNALFTATWFIGRTRAENAPTGTLRDRFREPVLRNNYVATQQSVAVADGDPFLDANGDPVRVVHIDSRTGTGGDGTFENPYSRLDLVNQGAEQAGDILLVHAGSSYTADSISLLDQQRLLGEGTFNDPVLGPTNIRHDVTLLSGEVIQLPETQSGAFGLSAPTVDNTGTALTAVTMNDQNEVNNLNVTGGVTAVGSGAFMIDGTSGAGDPAIRNLEVASTTGSAIALNSRVRIDADDIDNDGDTTDRNIAFAVTIEDVVLNNIGDGVGNDFGIDINASDTDGLTADFGDRADVEQFEATTISDVTVNGGSAIGVAIRNTNTDATNANVGVAQISDYNYSGGTTGGGALLVENADGATTLNSGELVGDATGVNPSNGVTVQDSAGNVTVGSSVELSSFAGEAVLVDGGDGSHSFAGDITNTAGESVRVANATGGSVAVTGRIVDTGDGVTIQNNSGGLSVNVNPTSGLGNTIDVSSNPTADAVTVTGNDGTTVTIVDTNITTAGGTGVEYTGNNSASGLTLTTVDIETTSGAGVNATGDGTVAASNTTIETDTGRAIDLNGVAISGAGARFTNVTVNNGTTDAVVLNDLTGGSVILGGGTGNGGGGTINTTGQAINATNVSSVQASNLTLNTGDVSQSFTNTDSTPMLVTLNNVDADAGVEVSHTGTGLLTFAYSDSTLTIADGGSTDAVIGLTATGSGPIDFLTDGVTLASSDTNRAGLSLSLTQGVTDADVSIIDSNLSVLDAQALGLVVNTNNAAAVRFELSGTTLASTNSGASARVGDVAVQGTSTLDATIVGNTLNPTVGADGFEVEQLGVSTVNLRLENNNIANGSIDLTSAASGAYNVAAADSAAVQSVNGNDVLFNGNANGDGDPNFTFDDTITVTPPNN